MKEYTLQESLPVEQRYNLNETGWTRPHRWFNRFEKGEYQLIAMSTHEKPFTYEFRLIKNGELLEKGYYSAKQLKELLATYNL